MSPWISLGKWFVGLGDELTILAKVFLEIAMRMKPAYLNRLGGVSL